MRSRWRRRCSVNFDRKGADGARFQAAPDLSIAGASSRIAIGPNSTTPLALTFSGLRGAGEYTGTIRFSAPGSKPVDQDFTLNLRESQWIAFLTIALGVIVSALLKSLGQNIRPRLVQTRRAQLLVREIDELMSVPDRAPVEQAVLRSLRRSVVAVLLDLDGGPVDGVSDRLDRLNARRALAAVWLVRRGEVETLRPAALRDRFRTVLEQAQALIVDDAAAAAAVTTMDAELRELPARMNEAVRTELVAGIAALRESLNALVGTSWRIPAADGPGPDRADPGSGRAVAAGERSSRRAGRLRTRPARVGIAADRRSRCGDLRPAPLRARGRRVGRAQTQPDAGGRRGPPPAGGGPGRGGQPLQPRLGALRRERHPGRGPRHRPDPRSRPR